MKYILFPPIRPPSPPLRQLLIIIMKFPNLSRHKHLRSGEERRKKCSLPKFIVYKNLALPSSVDYIVCSFCSGHFLLEKAQIKICTATLLHPVTYTLHNTTRQTQIWMFILCSFLFAFLSQTYTQTLKLPLFSTRVPQDSRFKHIY